MFEDSLLETCQAHSADKFYLHPDIPAKKERNARGAYGIPKVERVLALIDSTRLGSAKTGLAIAPTGVYFRNAREGGGTSGSFLPWAEVEGAMVSPADENCVILAPGSELSLSRSSFKPHQVRELFEAILGAVAAHEDDLPARPKSSFDSKLASPVPQENSEEDEGSTNRLVEAAPPVSLEAVDAIFGEADKRFSLEALAGLILADDSVARPEIEFLAGLESTLGLAEGTAARILFALPTPVAVCASARTITSLSVKQIVLEQLMVAAHCDGKYDKRERSYLTDVGNALGVPGEYLERLESECAQVRNWKKIGLTGAGAVLAVGVSAATAGVAAPAIGGMISGLMGMSLSGAAASSAGLATLGMGSIASGGMGVAGGTAVVASSGGVLGLFKARSVAKAYGDDLKNFSIELIEEGDHRKVLFLGCPVALEFKTARTWFDILRETFPGASLYDVRWAKGIDLKQELAGKVKTRPVDKAKGMMNIFASRATADASKLLGAAAAPHVVANLLKNPLLVSAINSKKAARVLACSIETSGSAADVILVGHGLGAKLVLDSLLALSPTTTVKAVHTVGAAAESDPHRWSGALAHSQQGLTNTYCPTDRYLESLYKVGTLLKGTALGLGALEGLENVQNHDVSGVFKQLNGYRGSLEQLPQSQQASQVLS